MTVHQDLWRGKAKSSHSLPPNTVSLKCVQMIRGAGTSADVPFAAKMGLLFSILQVLLIFTSVCSLRDVAPVRSLVYRVLPCRLFVQHSITRNLNIGIRTQRFGLLNVCSLDSTFFYLSEQAVNYVIAQHY